MANQEKNVMRRLEGKVILVAGAGGIGGGLAERYAAEGAQVVLGDISVASAEAVVGEIEQAGGTAKAIHLDGADEESIQAAIAVCVNSYGGLDGLHANFASFADSNPEQGIIELPLDTYDEVQRVNARGFYLCTRAALPVLVERGGGAIVYTSSSGAYNSGLGHVAYAMSKAAGHALMRHVAMRYGPQGVRANTLAPALTLHANNEMFVPAQMVEMAKKGASIKSRVGRPEDLAAMGALLLSDEGAYITGQVICIDGGTIMRS